MTQPDAADAIMEIMQSYVDKERKKIWELVTKQNQEWCKNARRFVQHYIDREKNSSQDSLNQVYAKGVFAGGGVGGVLAHAKELLKANGHTIEPIDIEKLVGRNEQLFQALKKYGQHIVLCPQSLPPDERPCDCGLDAEIRSQ